MTPRRQINELLRQVPEEAMPQVITFLKSVAEKRGRSSTKQRRKNHKAISVAQRSFGAIPVDASILKQVLAEDLYDLE